MNYSNVFSNQFENSALSLSERESSFARMAKVRMGVISIVLLMLSSFISQAQTTTVFTENFNRAALATGAPTTYTTSVTAGDGAASIPASNFLTLTNDGTAAANVAGKINVSGLTSSFSAPFNSTLTSNTGLITWSMNLKFNRTSAPSGFGAGNYAAAWVLTSTASNFNTAGNGYAIVYGGTAAATRGYRLVKFATGLAADANLTDVINASTASPSTTPAAVNNYVSVRVTLDPATSTWTMYFKDDGASAWGDPTTVSTQVGTATVDNTYTGSAMTNFGYFFNYSTAAAQTAQVDNLTVTVTNPTIAIASNHPSAGSINQGSADNLIGSFSYAVSGYTAQINSLSVTTSGTYSSSDIATNGLKFWINSINALSGATQLGTSQAAVGTGGTVAVSGLTTSIPAGATRYIFVTASLSAGATLGNTIGITSTPFSSLVFASGQKTGTDPVGASNFQTIAAIPPGVALSNVSPAAGNINQNSTSNILYSVQVDVTAASTTLNSVSFTTAGTYTTSDLTATPFKVWINSTNSVSGATQLGSSQVAVSSGGTISITGLSQSFPIATRYILVTADITFDAVAGHTISITSTPFSSLTFASGVLSGTNPVATGNAQTIAAVTPAIAVALVSPLTAANVGVPSTKNNMYQLSFAVTSNSTVLNSLSFTTTGTYVSSNLVSNSFKLWYSTTNALAGATQIGTSQAIVSTGGIISFTGLSQLISAGTTGYVWVTFDANNTGGGNTIGITSTSFLNMSFSQGTLSGTNPSAAGGLLTMRLTPSVTEVILPQYAISGATTASRLQYVCRLRLTDLTPNATYRYLTGGVNGSNAGNMYVINNTANADGYITGYSSGKSLAGTLMSGNVFDSANRFGQFVSDGTGAYEGWFSIVPTSNAAFNPGTSFTVAVTLNDGAGGTTTANVVTTTNTVTSLDPTTTTGSARSLSGASDGSPENMIFLYDNTAGTGRPLAGTWVESDGITTNFTTWYTGSVDNGVSGKWGTYIPSALVNGVRRIEQRNTSDGTISGCPATSANGTWGATNTVNPTAGTSALSITGLVFTAPTYYADVDGDGYGNPSSSTQSCSAVAGYVSNNLDCNDASASINPLATETCNGIDDNCNNTIDEGFDLDGDGVTSCNGDCDDSNNTVYTGAPEICDGIDNNCNTAIDETPPSWYVDADGDGYGTGSAILTQCADPGVGYSSSNTDCNDANALINPLTIWYKDADGDTYSDGVTQGPVCARPSGYFLASELTATTGDCNDSNASINPTTIWYRDNDGDTYGDPSVTLTQCAQPVGYVSNSSDCNDASASIKPGATEIACNGVDENCNGNIDGDAAGAVLGCTDPGASNYNSGATCENGSCTYAFSYVPGNLVVLRVGTGAAALSSSSTQVVIDQFSPTTANQSAPLNSRRIPGAGTTALTQSGSASSEGQISRSPDGQSIVLAGYTAFLGTTTIASTASATVPRCVGVLDKNNAFTRPVTSSSFYSANNIRSATKNGSDYWAAGPVSGIAYMGTGSPIVITNTPLSNWRVVSAQNGKLYASTATSTTGFNRGVYRIGANLPTNTGTSIISVLSDAANTSSPYGFYFNPAETVCFVADDRTTAGLQKWTKTAGVWSLAYTVSPATGYGASSVYVDWFSEATPVVYAIATNGTTTKLVRFNDNGTSTPTVTTLATAATNTAFRSVAFAPSDELVWYRDADGDGFGNNAVTLTYSIQPYGYVADNTDCNDNDITINPLTVWYKDADGDEYSDGATIVQCAQPAGYYQSSALTATSGDCNDSDAAINPGATEVCNSIDDDCNTQIDENDVVISVSITGIGTVSPSGPVTLSCGDSQLFDFTPDPCYEVTDIMVDGISVGSDVNYQFTGLTASHNLHVVYSVRSLPIIVNTTGVGTYNAQGAVLCGNSTNVFFTAGDCYSIASVSVNGVDVPEAANTPIYQLSLTNVTVMPIIDVVFAIRTYTVSVGTTSPDGSSAAISPSTSVITYNCGDAATYTFTPGACSQIQNVLLNGISQGAVSSLTLPDIRTNYAITVYTSIINYDITATATIGGIISNGGTVTYNCGDQPSYTVTSFSGYGLVGVTVDGSPVGAITNYTFSALSGNHTISAIFAPETVNNSWNNAQQMIAPMFPSCASVSGTLAGCSGSSQASYVSFPSGAGQDAWYRFQMPTNSTGIVKITANSSVNDLAIVLQREISTSPFYQALTVENALNAVGNEQLVFSGLVPGAYYRIGIKNMGIQNAGTFSLCVSPLKASTCGTISSPTNGKSLCDLFLGTYSGAQVYTFTFTNTTNPSEVFTMTNTGAAGGPATSAIALNALPGLQYGSSYYVKIDASYTFYNGAGLSNTVVVPGAVNGCILYTATQPNTELAYTDRCGNGPNKKFNSFISTDWVCGAVDYQWEITPTTGLPIPSITNRGVASRYVLVNSLVGIHGGATTFNVRVRPVFANGQGGVNYGVWSTTPRQLCLLASGGLIEENSPEHIAYTEKSLEVLVNSSEDFEVYPNPNSGNFINVNATGCDGLTQVRIMDSTGQVVYKNQYTAESRLNVILSLEQSLASGLYMIEITNNNQSRTKRVMVER